MTFSGVESSRGLVSVHVYSRRSYLSVASKRVGRFIASSVQRHEETRRTQGSSGASSTHPALPFRHDSAMENVIKLPPAPVDDL